MKHLTVPVLTVVLVGCHDLPVEPRAPISAVRALASLTGPSTPNATITWLGDGDGKFPRGVAWSINASGAIVGGCCTVSGNPGKLGVVFRSGPIRPIRTGDDPLTLGIDSLTVVGGLAFDKRVQINDAGLILSNGGCGRPAVGSLVEPGSFLPTLFIPDACGEAYANGINNAGDVVGTQRPCGHVGCDPHPFLWRRTASGYQQVDLGLLDGVGYEGKAIAPGLTGAETIVVGGTVGGPQAFIWRESHGMMALPRIGSGPTGAEAFDVGDNGAVVGWAAALPGPSSHAVVWQDDQAIDLHPPCAALFTDQPNRSRAYAIALIPSVPRRTLIVGFCGVQPAVWYDNGAGGYTAELLPMLTGDDHGEAVDVNTSGQIVGWTRGDIFAGATSHAVLWHFAVPPLPGEPDNTPPVVTPSVTGSLGNNSWYTSNVVVSWSVTDNESPISTQTGCGQTTISADTPGQTLTCSATSAGGTASQSATIKRDATAPTLSPTVSPNPVLLNGTATAAANASDNLSGVATASCNTVATGTVGSNQSVACRAIDNAGNSANATASYTVREPTTPEERADALAEQVRDLVELGILDAAQAAGLIDKLNEILAKVQAGKVRVACNQLRSFINQVQGFIKSGKLTSVQGQPLIDAAEGIRADLGC